MENLPDENSKRFVVILNKKIEIGRLLNALGHMTAGLAGGAGKPEQFCFLRYTDKDNGAHPGISHFPFIVLQADNSNKIRAVRNKAIERGIKFTDFTSTMILGTSKEQMRATKETPEAKLEYYGICLFGETAELREITGKFSLFRN